MVSFCRRARTRHVAITSVDGDEMLRLPIVIDDSEFRSENASGLSVGAHAQAIQQEGFEMLGVASYGDLSAIAQQPAQRGTPPPRLPGDPPVPAGCSWMMNALVVAPCLRHSGAAR
jgi:hypothetical protein